MFLDDTNLIAKSVDTDGIFHCENPAKSSMVNKIICSGEEVFDIVFVDVNKGFAIQVTKTLDGQIVVVDGSISHRIIYGEFEVISKELKA